MLSNYAPTLLMLENAKKLFANKVEPSCFYKRSALLFALNCFYFTKIVYEMLYE